MTRHPINLTAAEWASVQPDGTLWLAWEGTPCMAHEFDSPVEFVQACAPCARCKDTRVIHAETFPTPCPYCRIELVGPCPECVKVMSDRDKPCTTVTLGHAYAIGQPLPIDWAKSGHSEPFVGVWKPPYPPTVLFLAYDTEGIPIDLAHYGPPDTLVDRWAIQLRVVQ